MAGTYKDTNKNFKQDKAEGEKAEQLDFTAAVQGKGKEEKEKGRAIVAGNTEMLSDFWVRNQGNLIFIDNGLKWLITDEEEITPITKIAGEDIPIQHTSDEYIPWFYGTIFGVPGLILFGGLYYVRRQNRRRRKP